MGRGDGAVFCQRFHQLVHEGEQGLQFGVRQGHRRARDGAEARPQLWKGEAQFTPTHVHQVP